MSATHIGVVGGGQMGRGIAQVAAQSGCEVVLADADQHLAERAVATIADTLGRLVAKGKLSADDAHSATARLRAAATLDDLAECDVVIEAAPEDEALKSALLRDLDRICAARTILASNTSSIPIARLGEVTDRPDRVIGMHFMNPVPLMSLVEIIRADATSDETYEAVTALATSWGKTSITSSDTAGFIVNRMALPFLNEAYLALEEGVGTAADIDTGARLGLNHPMGPLELSDHIGLDTCLAVLEVLHRELGHERFRPSRLLVDYVAQGRLGKKVGRGFYEYDETGGKR